MNRVEDAAADHALHTDLDDACGNRHREGLDQGGAGRRFAQNVEVGQDRGAVHEDVEDAIALIPVLKLSEMKR